MHEYEVISLTWSHELFRLTHAYTGRLPSVLSKQKAVCASRKRFRHRGTRLFRIIPQSPSSAFVLLRGAGRRRGHDYHGREVQHTLASKGGLKRCNSVYSVPRKHSSCILESAQWRRRCTILPYLLTNDHLDLARDDFP